MDDKLQAQPTDRDTGRRAGATWVAAVGAFLLVAAAAVFVAVRWHRLTASWKLALVVGVTLACLAGGRRLRRSLPATGDVLFHLGAFLLAVDLAAAGARMGMGWRTVVLAEGVLGLVVLGGLGRATGSVVLRWAGIASVPVVAAGVAALTPVPAPLVLAAAALATDLTVRRRDPEPVAHGGIDGPVAWAALAGLAPLLGAASALVAGAVAAGLGAGTLADLGLAGPAQVAGAPLAGALAACVLARRATRTADVRLAFLAVASVAVGLATSVAGVRVPPVASVLGLAAAFAVVELVALALRNDPFWSRPLGQVATVAQATVGVGAVWVASRFLLDPWRVEASGQDWVLGLALATAGLAWSTAALHRRLAPADPSGTCRGERQPASSSATSSDVAMFVLAASACFVAGTAVATASGVAAAAAMVTVSALALAGRRPGALAMAGVGAPWALAVTVGHPVAGPALAFAGAAVAAYAAAMCSTDRRRRDASVLLAASAVCTTVGAGAVVAFTVAPDAAVAITAAALWIMAFLLDGALPSPPEKETLHPAQGAARALLPAQGAARALHPAQGAARALPPEDRDRCLGDTARAAMLLPVLAALTLAPRQTVLGVCLVAVLYVVDALRLDRPQIGCAAGLVVQGLVVQTSVVSGLTLAASGMALCVGAVVWSGLAVVVDARWRPPFVVAAGGGLVGGLLLTTAEPVAFASALLVAGCLVGLAGVVSGRLLVAHGGGALVCLGLAVHMQQLGVTVPEPYLVPVAAQSVILGRQLRCRRPLSSWRAYGPAVVLLGGVALLERLDGGGGGHALVAGAVGVVAVAVGGWRWLIGPLFTGTALLVVVTVNESLATLAGVPTWAWLGTAGLALLAAGVTMERADSSPTEAGLRLVDVLADRYS